jgi:hypothetical protein
MARMGMSPMVWNLSFHIRQGIEGIPTDGCFNKNKILSHWITWITRNSRCTQVHIVHWTWWPLLFVVPMCLITFKRVSENVHSTPFYSIVDHHCPRRKCNDFWGKPRIFKDAPTHHIVGHIIIHSSPLCHYVISTSWLFHFQTPSNIISSWLYQLYLYFCVISYQVFIIYIYTYCDVMSLIISYHIIVYLIF